VPGSAIRASVILAAFLVNRSRRRRDMQAATCVAPRRGRFIPGPRRSDQKDYPYRGAYDNFLIIVSLGFNAVIVWYAWSWAV
jgi:hypothetical protein